MRLLPLDKRDFDGWWRQADDYSVVCTNLKAQDPAAYAKMIPAEKQFRQDTERAVDGVEKYLLEWADSLPARYRRAASDVHQGGEFMREAIIQLAAAWQVLIGGTCDATGHQFASQSTYMFGIDIVYKGLERLERQAR